MNTDADESADKNQVERGRRRYLVAPAPADPLNPASPPVAADILFEEVKALPRARFLRVLRRADPRAAQNDRTAQNTQNTPGGPVGVPAFPPVAVVELPDEQAQALGRVPGVIVEPDRPLSHVRATPTVPARPGEAPPVGGAGPETRLAFLVRGPDGAPVPSASVLVVGGGWPARGVTDPDGRVALTVAADDLAAVEGVCVTPAHSYWDRWIDRPGLRADADNLITLRRLDEAVAGPPARSGLGWGQRAMRLPEVPPTYRGAGARIAIVDSGVTGDHPDLKGQVNAGIDLIEPAAAAWSVDVDGHGSHCAGVIAGAEGGGLAGFAPDAEIHSCRIFPGGHFSDLIEALDYCVEHQIDVVNLSVGARGGSLLVSQKIAQAREAGVACVAAAGSTGDAVHFPACLPTVLTVAALGQAGAFPPDSHHATQIAGPLDARGLFSARFSCSGPEVDVCAPGVAIVSCVPGGHYAAWDGASAAAPHVTGLAALAIAHRAEFAGPLARRDGARVRHLFEVIVAACQPVADGSRDRYGAGMPDAPIALGLAPIVTGAPPIAGGMPVPPDVARLLVVLRAAAERAGLVPARLA